MGYQLMNGDLIVFIVAYVCVYLIAFINIQWF